MAKRKTLAKKLRFEVLKRDQFTCQYCGAKAPDVLLEVDHINAVANGGTNSVLNLITSCESCNNGKRDVPLSSKATVEKARSQAAALQARRDQIKMMAEWQSSLVDLEQEATMAAQQVISKLTPGWCLSESALAEVRGYVSKYGLDVVCSEFRSSAGKFGRMDGDQMHDESCRVVYRTALNALRYREANQKDPIGSRARYLRGFLKNKFHLSYANYPTALGLLTEALSLGVDESTIRDIIASSYSWSRWFDDTKEVVDAAKGAAQ